VKVLFVTDLRGDPEKYRRIEELAIRERVVAVLNGGDMYPRGPELHRLQARFIDEVLASHLERLGDAGIHFLGVPGNDDLKALDARFAEACARARTAQAIAGARTVLGRFEFIGFSLVADGPFRLKDRCRRDQRSSPPSPQKGTALLSEGSGFREVPDWPHHLESLPTLDEELDRLPRPEEPSRAVCLFHAPPAGVGLDRSGEGRDVGSRAVHRYIMKTRPRMSLHGHAPKSPEVSQVWCTRIGRTVSIQPGAREDLLGVLIDLATTTAVLKTFASPSKESAMI
jgi:uncharacterized protein